MRNDVISVNKQKQNHTVTYNPHSSLCSHAGCTDALRHDHNQKFHIVPPHIPSLYGGSLWDDGPSSFITSSSICIGYLLACKAFRTCFKKYNNNKEKSNGHKVTLMAAPLSRQIRRYEWNVKKKKRLEKCLLQHQASKHRGLSN